MARESRDGFASAFAPELHTLVEELALALDAPAEVREEAIRVARLQDLGRLGVSQLTLAADRRLNDSEIDEIRRAPMVAQSLVAAMPGYESAARAVRHVNERWDGEGYPDGLAGEEIPLASRIMAVAGAFHAMSTPRPFRAAMKPKTIAKELTSGSGSQFDPRVVAAFQGLVQPLIGD